MVEVGMMGDFVNFNSFENREDLIQELSNNIIKNLQDAIEQKNHATLIVSGGSTPKPLFEKLRQSKIEWKKVTIGLCDERWVEPTHKDSNENFVKTYLLQDEAKEAKFVGMYIDKIDIKEADIRCTQNIRESLYPFDVLILGLGEDAHTASLFPDNPKLEKAFDLNNKDLCIDIQPKDAPHKRMSLTLSAILSASHLYLHFEGKSKLSVYQKAINSKDLYKMPIGSILHQEKKAVEVYWA